MALYRLKSAPFILIEDDSSKNVLPLLLELLHDEKNTVNLFAYEQPVNLWKNIFRNHSNVYYYDEFCDQLYQKYVNGKCSILIDSVNQMVLSMGWNECLKVLKCLQSDVNVNRLILILHLDCITHNTKLQTHLNHMASAVVSYDTKNSNKIWVKLKKGNKLMKSEEILSYDSRTCTLRSTAVLKEEAREADVIKPTPGNLTTFKIEVDQTEKIEKYKLKLPYMSKIHEGESKVYYEPDAVDDWDEEDPDEDLDI